MNQCNRIKKVKTNVCGKKYVMVKYVTNKYNGRIWFINLGEKIVQPVCIVILQLLSESLEFLIDPPFLVEHHRVQLYENDREQIEL